MVLWLGGFPLVKMKCACPWTRGTVALWLVHSTLERAVWVQALARDIVLCSWARHFTLTVPLSTQVYKWVPAKLMLEVALRWTSIPSRGGVEILQVASCYRNRDKLWPTRPQLAHMQTLPYLPYLVHGCLLHVCPARPPAYQNVQSSCILYIFANWLLQVQCLPVITVYLPDLLSTVRLADICTRISNGIF